MGVSVWLSPVYYPLPRCLGVGQKLRPSILSIKQETRRPSYLYAAMMLNVQAGKLVAFEVIVELRDEGFQELLGVVDRLREIHGQQGIFASETPAEVRSRYC